ncbi:VanW family protein [Candidatus Uhrbacteria bacterium]|nr:VanW family protein [Candidatus Uhrbacteria bacterium]
MKQSSTTPRWLLAIIFFLLLILGILVAFEAAASRRIYPGVRIGSISVSGATPEEARRKIQQAADDYLRKGLTFNTSGRRVAIESVIIAPGDPDLYYELLSFDAEAAVKSAYAFGRNQNALNNWRNIISASFDKKIIPATFKLNRDRLAGILKQNLSDLENAPVDASWKIILADGRPQFTVIKESGGYIFDYGAAFSELEASIIMLQPKEITIGERNAKPKITAEDVNAAIPEAEKILGRAPLELSANGTKWTLQPAKIAEWLEVEKKDGVPRAAFNEIKIKEALQSWGEQFGLDKKSKNAKFELKDGKVAIFQSSEDGRKLASEANAAAIENALLDGEADTPVLLSLEVAEPEFRTDEVNAFGIKELIGIAATSFAGSPKNRKHNIKVAVEKLNGLIVPAGEEFSLIKAIGAVNAEAGFKEELVIKGDKTTPEFGGGLCQIATTIFRAALKSGLPILERQSHSYRVPYYEPPVGMDATIYQPKPDFRFKNDTGAAILILSSISGDKLTFEFWGASDGRIAQTTEPVVTNVVAPPPPKLVITEELPPGIKKCTEKAHVGSDASFVYTITRPDGTKEEKTFRSHYRPWQEVCLVGAAPGGATSTEKTALTE